MIRKLEYFEDQLKGSPLGREVLKVLRHHATEVMYLVQKNRPTMVCWNRNHGPRFIKSFVDSGFEMDVEFTREINGVKVETLLLSMAEVLQDKGTPELKQTIGKYAAPVLEIARDASSLRDVIKRINNTHIVQRHD